MSDAAPDDLATRLRQLEKDVRDLRLRVADLERRLNPRSENPDDRTTVREKVVYDWQA